MVTFYFFLHTNSCGHVVRILKQHHLLSKDRTDQIREKSRPVFAVIAAINKILFTEERLLITELGNVCLISEVCLDECKQLVYCIYFGETFDIITNGRCQCLGEMRLRLGRCVDID